MSSTISSSSASSVSQSTLASALLSLTQNTEGDSSSTDTGVDATAGLDLDSLQLSSSSLASLESTAETVAAQNKNSVISSSEDALATNLAAISALFSDPTSAQAAQSSSTTDSSQVLSLLSS